ncbi:hypothetical protein FSB78_01140 [Sphingomonas ginsenosidivorax]|uniref:Glycosyl transferase n=1 Tax=Sphingomonas ginsenosidivorax TaxID=862135 RepID=A0A5C6UB14_9SPHN|nr:hypothetical protein [Sphingomonas ginsenosidivorax]TXC69720.1 hypothetical protein FSB78_01140 [Sphingomonas ginsenosidivorax]
MHRKVAFLFLGETLLIPHLYPIVEALAAADPALPIELWASTSMHAALLERWSADLPSVRIRRAPGFRTVGDVEGRNPALPAKLPMLARLLPHLARTPVVVCAEQTSLWLPAVVPLKTRFIDTFHGAGSMMARGHWRRRAGWRTLVAAERDRRALIAGGDTPSRVVTTGYVKAAFRQRTPATTLFANTRPVVLYTPHWQAHRSSWWRWGPEVVERVLADGRYNLIFAPHQRLAERAPDLRPFAEGLAGRPGVHVDLDSFAMVDGSYTAAADAYLGDTSSQVVEYMIRPRPCVFLNALGADWKGDVSYEMWGAGEVVETLDSLIPALERAPAMHEGFAAFQARFVEDALGDIGGGAPTRAAAQILMALER